MKKKDIVLIAGIVFVTGLISYFISGLFFAPPKDRKEQVEVVEAISTEFNKPDAKYFNPNSIDPTQPITIGDTNNQQPFNKPSGQ